MANNSAHYSISSSNQTINSLLRYGLSYDSTTEREVNFIPVDNRMQNQLNRAF